VKNRSCVLLLVMMFAATAVCLAADNAAMGTWKLNESKSKIAPGMPNNHTVVYSAEGDKVNVTVDGVDSKGNSTHTEWTGKFDGNDYLVTGDPTTDSRSYKLINDHTMDLTNKKDGKVVSTGHAVVSPDGKTRTVTVKAKDNTGKEVTSVTVYDKQ